MQTDQHGWVPTDSRGLLQQLQQSFIVPGTTRAAESGIWPTILVTTMTKVIGYEYKYST
jgi:hypothetical protein